MERIREATRLKESELSVMDAAGIAPGVTTLEETNVTARISSRNSAMLAERGGQRRLFVPMDKTEEWAENNYYRLPIGDEHPDLVPVNAFWKDYAAWDGEGAVPVRALLRGLQQLPRHDVGPGRAGSAVQGGGPKAERADGSITLQVEEPVIVFHQEVRESKARRTAPRCWSARTSSAPTTATGTRTTSRSTSSSPRSSSQRRRLRRPGGGDQPDHLAAEARRAAADPAGRDAGAGSGFYTRGSRCAWSPTPRRRWSTTSTSRRRASFPHYPVHVAQDEEVIAHAEPFTFKVVDKLSKVDKASWAYITQYGSDAEVLDYLSNHNLARGSTWRRSPGGCRESGVLREGARPAARRATCTTTRSGPTAILHDDAPAVRQFLLHTQLRRPLRASTSDRALLAHRPGRAAGLRSTWSTSRWSTRAHRVGADRKILNDRIREQYQRFLQILS